MGDFYTNCVTYGNQIYFRGIRDGERVCEKIHYKPNVFIPSNKESKYKTNDGRNLEKISPGTIKETKDFLNQYKDVHGFEIFGNTEFHYCYISDTYPGHVDYDVSKIVVANIDIEVYSTRGFPEPEDAFAPITAITVIFGKEIYTFAMPYDSKDVYKPASNVKYYQFNSEIDMLTAFIDVWESRSPDIITGWNIQFFDIPYLVNRITKIISESEAKRLSPWKAFGTRKSNYKGKEIDTVIIHGVSILDYIELYRKYQPRLESEKLNYVAYHELGKTKTEFKGSLGKLYRTDFQTYIDYNINDSVLVGELDNKLKIIDMVLATAYDAKVNFTDVLTQVRMVDSLIFNDLREENLVVPGKKNNKKVKYPGGYVKEVIPGEYKSVLSFDVSSEYPNAMISHNISPETIVDGKYVKLVDIITDDEGKIRVECGDLLNESFDLSYLKDDNLCLSASGYYFTREKQGFLPRILSRMIADRKEYQKKKKEWQDRVLECNKELLKCHSMPGNGTVEWSLKLIEAEREVSRYHNWQLAKKVQLNSVYGALGNEYFRFYDVRLASSITIAGQVMIQWVAKDVNKYMNTILKTNNVDYIIAIDTDSIYLTMEKLLEVVFKGKERTIEKDVNYLDKVAKEVIQKKIDESFIRYHEYFNTRNRTLAMKRETIATKAIWTAKKRYMLLAYDIEGKKYPNGELKMQGIEAVKSNTPEICREGIKSSIMVVMKKTQKDLYKHVEEFKKEFMNAGIDEISKSSQCNNLAEYSDSNNIFKLGSPQHVKGSLIYNELLKRQKLENEYPEVREGDRVKTVCLRLPNSAQVEAISYPEILPPEFNLDNRVNKDKQFEIVFLKPLSMILDAIDWKAEEAANLDALF